MLGERLRALRKQQRMTQEQLAKLLNMAKSTISQYENNINEPDIETIVRLADYFQVSVDDLIGRDFYPQPEQSNKEELMLKENLTEDEAEYLKESLALFRKWKGTGQGNE